jgi:hypothetical protein
MASCRRLLLSLPSPTLAALEVLRYATAWPLSRRVLPPTWREHAKAQLNRASTDPEKSGQSQAKAGPVEHQGGWPKIAAGLNQRDRGQRCR